MTLSPTDYGLLGMVLTTLLALISWVIRSTVRAFIAELSAARAERQQPTERLATVIGESTATMQMSQHTLVAFGADIGALTQMIRDHDRGVMANLGELRQSLQRFVSLTQPTEERRTQ